MGALEGLGGQILDTFVVSEGLRGQILDTFVVHLSILGAPRPDPRYIRQIWGAQELREWWLGRPGRPREPEMDAK